jgi:hypothetical protein
MKGVRRRRTRSGISRISWAAAFAFALVPEIAHATPTDGAAGTGDCTDPPTVNLVVLAKGTTTRLVRQSGDACPREIVCATERCVFAVEEGTYRVTGGAVDESVKVGPRDTQVTRSGSLTATIIGGVIGGIGIGAVLLGIGAAAGSPNSPHWSTETSLGVAGVGSAVAAGGITLLLLAIPRARSTPIAW